MRECSRCGVPAQSGDGVCRACGATLAADSAPPPSARDAGAVPAPSSTGGAGGESAPAHAASAAGQDGRETPPKRTEQQPGAPWPTSPPPTLPAAPVSPYPYAYPFVYAVPPGAPYYPQVSGQGTLAQPPAMQMAPGSPPPYPYWGYPMYAAYAPYYAYPQRPRNAPGEGYRVFLAWLVTVLSGLTFAVGMLLVIATGLAVARGSAGLATLGGTAGFTVGPLAAGVAGLYFGIRAIMKRPSARFVPPVWWVLALIALGILAGEVAIWNVTPVPDEALTALPVFFLAGLLPALAILAFTSGRLRHPTTWRHAMVSLGYGATGAILFATILEFIAQIVINILLGLSLTFGLEGIPGLNPTNGTQAIALVLLLTVVAPVVEEAVKPVAAILALPRMRSAGEAFLVGMAAGIGFAVVETLGYFGLGQADWISVAIERVGVGLLHGVGAGMTAMGWYLLVRGKGVRGRWLKGFGAIVYAIVQHGLFNGSNYLGAVPGIDQFSRSLFYVGKLPVEAGVVIALALYAAVLVVLIIVTGRLRGPRGRAGAPPEAGPGGTGQADVARVPEPTAALGGAR